MIEMKIGSIGVIGMGDLISLLSVKARKKEEDDDKVMLQENFDSVVVANYIDTNVDALIVDSQFDAFPPSKGN